MTFGEIAKIWLFWTLVMPLLTAAGFGALLAAFWVLKELFDIVRGR